MSKKIKAVSLDSEAANEVPLVEETKVEEASVDEPKVEDIIEEEIKEATTPKNEDVKIDEIIKEAVDEKPKPSRKMITCPDCNKTMLEKNFRYQHLSVCGKVKQPKLRAKPIEEVIKEKREKAEPKPKPVEVEQVPPPPPPVAKPTYWELRKEYNNQLHERKINLVKKLVSSAF